MFYREFEEENSEEKGENSALWFYAFKLTYVKTLSALNVVILSRF